MGNEAESKTIAPAADVPPADAALEASASAEPGSEVEAKEATPPASDAPASESDSAPAEPAAEQPTPKESAIARALRSRESKLVERQNQHAREREEWTAYTERLKPQIQAFNQERELAKGDPFKWLEQVHGIREEDLARRWINGGKPSPQEAEHREKSAAEKRLEALEAEVAAARKEKADAAARAERETAQKAAESKLVSITKANASKYPLAARLSEADLIEEANLIAGASQTGLSFAQILDKIEQRAKRFGGATSAPLPASSATPAVATKSPEKQGQKGQEAGAAQSGKTAPTLNGKDASQRASMPKIDPLLLDPEEERRRIIAEIDKVKKERNASA